MSSSLSESNSALLALSNSLADTVDRAGRAVVTVNARSRIPSSGVHWRQGVIVTADHAIKREEEITITLADNSTVPATLAGRDSSTDLAVLTFQGSDLPPAAIGDTDSLKVGHMVLALGRSGDRGLSASFGVVSALGGAWRTWCGGSIDRFVRLDLTLYPGFSGGPLVDASGRIVGINTSGPRNMVLAIPVSTVNRAIAQLLERGHIVRGYLGIGMQPVLLPETLKSALNLRNNSGVIVVNIEPNGPADTGGVLIGDVIIGLDRAPIADTGDIQAILGSDSVGKTMSVELIRGGQLVEVAIAIGERPRR